MSRQSDGPYVARRDHGPCDLCGQLIHKGESCERWTKFPSGDPPLTVRVHVSCRDEAKQYEWYADEWWPEEFPLIEQRAIDRRVP